MLTVSNGEGIINRLLQTAAKAKEKAKMQEENTATEHKRAQEEDVREHEKHKHKVTVSVDGKERKLEPGTYVVSEFKREVHVDAEKELEEIVHGELKPLDDAATITIKGGEVFVSHVRRGGSS
jgi:hypothetical protein